MEQYNQKTGQKEYAQKGSAAEPRGRTPSRSGFTAGLAGVLVGAVSLFGFSGSAYGQTMLPSALESVAHGPFTKTQKDRDNLLSSAAFLRGQEQQIAIGEAKKKHEEEMEKAEELKKQNEEIQRLIEENNRLHRELAQRNQEGGRNSEPSEVVKKTPKDTFSFSNNCFYAEFENKKGYAIIYRLSKDEEVIKEFGAPVRADKATWDVDLKKLSQGAGRYKIEWFTDSLTVPAYVQEVTIPQDSDKIKPPIKEGNKAKIIYNSEVI